MDKLFTHKVVQDLCLENVTSNGWILVRVIEDEEMVCSMGEQQPNPYLQPKYQQPHGTPPTYIPRKRIRFLVAKKTSPHTEKLEQQIAELRLDLDERTAERNDLNGKLDEANTELKKTRDTNESLMKRTALLEGKVVEAETRGRTMEQDIGKLRAALGELRMKEILGG